MTEDEEFETLPLEDREMHDIQWELDDKANEIKRLKMIVATYEAGEEELENRLGDKIGHPEACEYTSRATHDEIIEHFVTREPDCFWFATS